MDNRVFGFPVPEAQFVLNPPSQSVFSEYQEDLRRRREEATDRLIEARRNQLTPLQRVIIRDKRNQSRITVKQVGQLADEALLQGIEPHDAFDDRPSVIKFLDMIDLPRNTIANIAWGSPTAEGVTKSLIGSLAAGATVGALASGLLGPGALGGAIVGGIAGLASFIGAAGVAGVARAFMAEPTVEDSFLGTRIASSGQRAIYFRDILERLGVEGKVKRAIIGFIGDVMMDPLTYLSGGGNVVGITLRSAVNHP
ncbi:MAG TPA: hypothetical protein VLA34_01510, partial [Candidatus Krumholzibacterium sp.]|nr:hypothetical protein [Candidatus Krumholzibacterium sp.]